MIKIGFIFGMAIYGIIWFLTLFMVLPWGVVSQAERRARKKAHRRGL